MRKQMQISLLPKIVLTLAVMGMLGIVVTGAELMQKSAFERMVGHRVTWRDWMLSGMGG
jgi:hypothetical protein